MYEILKHSHSGLRWLVLAFLVYAILNAFLKKNKATEFSKSDKLPVLFGLIFSHVQLILGLVLYFMSPKVSFASGFMKDTMTRFYTMEHISLMLIALVLITIGYSKAKRMEDPAAKHKTILFYYGIGLLLILVSIPWPFRELGAGWF
jgi:hypothetical protein